MMRWTIKIGWLVCLVFIVVVGIYSVNRREEKRLLTQPMHQTNEITVTQAGSRASVPESFPRKDKEGERKPVSNISLDSAEMKPDSVSPDKNPRDLVMDVVRHASVTVRDALKDSERFPELNECSSTGMDCEELYSDALTSVLAWPLNDDIFNDVYGLAELEETSGIDAVQDLLYENVEDIFSRSDDAVERLTALALLVSGHFPQPRPLDAYVFRDLSIRSDPEKALLLKQYERAPVDDFEVVDNILIVATQGSTDPEIRLRAVRTLGFAETAEQFVEAVDLIEEDGLLTRNASLSFIAPGLARCGIACLPGFVRLAQSNIPAARMATLAAVARLDPDDQRTVLDRIDPILREKDFLTREESNQLAYVTTVIRK